jgi:hypothetical protein
MKSIAAGFACVACVACVGLLLIAGCSAGPTAAQGQLGEIRAEVRTAGTELAACRARVAADPSLAPIVERLAYVGDDRVGPTVAQLADRTKIDPSLVPALFRFSDAISRCRSAALEKMADNTSSG